MSLIACDSNCSYQRDGYCRLDSAAEVTNEKKSGGCVYFIERKQDKKNGAPKGPRAI